MSCFENITSSEMGEDADSQDALGRFGSLDEVVSPSCHNVSTPSSPIPTLSEYVSAKLHKLPKLRYMSSSPRVIASPATSPSFSLRGETRSFDSIDSDNSERPKGLWYEFLQRYDGLEYDPNVQSEHNVESEEQTSNVQEGHSEDSTTPISVESPQSTEGEDIWGLRRNSQENDQNRSVPPRQLIHASASSLPTDAVQSSEETGAASQAEICEACSSQLSTNVMADSKIEETEVSEPDVAPEAKSWSLADLPAENSDRFYSMEFADERESSPARKFYSIRKNAGSKKERRDRANINQSSSPVARRSTPVSEIQEEHEGGTEEGSLGQPVRPSYTYRTFPSLLTSKVGDSMMDPRWRVNIRRYGGIRTEIHEDSARAVSPRIERFNVSVPSEAIFQRNSPLSLADHQLPDSPGDTKYKKQTSVRRVAGAYDRRRSRQGRDERTTRGKKPRNERLKECIPDYSTLFCVHRNLIHFPRNLIFSS